MKLQELVTTTEFRESIDEDVLARVRELITLEELTVEEEQGPPGPVGCNIM